MQLACCTLVRFPSIPIRAPHLSWHPPGVLVPARGRSHERGVLHQADHDVSRWRVLGVVDRLVLHDEAVVDQRLRGIGLSKNNGCFGGFSHPKKTDPVKLTLFFCVFHHLKASKTVTFTPISKQLVITP